MKIVIAGAGDVGFHLAKLLAQEQQDIILIDRNQDVLDYALGHLDVLGQRGDSTSIKVLKDARVDQADLVLAMTTSENDNIVTAILAKKLGAKQTVARVNNPEYLSKEQKIIFQELGIDKLISPVEFATEEIGRLLELCEATDNFEFENGAATLVGITLDDSSSFVGKSVHEINATSGVPFRPVAILRKDTTILPRANTVMYHNDHLYFLANKKDLSAVLKETGKQLHKIRRVMIVGGTQVAMRTAKKLESKYKVTIVAEEKDVCRRMTEKLDSALIIKGDPSNIELLKEEGLQQMDAFIALTKNSETNIITSLMAEDLGVFKTIALVDNIDYTHISQNIGIDTLINKKLIAANNIFRYVRKGKVEAITSLHGVDAEVIEYSVQKNNRTTKYPLRELHFPKNAIIGSVIRGGESIIPTGDFQLKKADKVIVFAMPDAIHKVEELFR